LQYSTQSLISSAVPVPAFVTLPVSEKSASPQVLEAGTSAMLSPASAFGVSVITTLTVESA
jgi:hypothetical protein